MPHEACQYNDLTVWCCAAGSWVSHVACGCRRYILLFVYVVFCSAGQQVNERRKKMNFLVNVCSLLSNHTSSQCLLDIRKYTECIVTSHILPVHEITSYICVLHQGQQNRYIRNTWPYNTHIKTTQHLINTVTHKHNHW